MQVAAETIDYGVQRSIFRRDLDRLGPEYLAVKASG
jgi:hypothetical protein